MRIACAFDKAYVKFGETVLDSDKYELDTENDTIEFEVAAAGTYVVVKGEAPVVPPAFDPDPIPVPGVFKNVTNYVDNFGKANLDTDVPKTGDDSNVALWGAVPAVSTAACAATVAVLCKKVKKD